MAESTARTAPTRPIDPKGRRHTVFQYGADGLIERWVSPDGCRTWELSSVKSRQEWDAGARAIMRPVGELSLEEQRHIEAMAVELAAEIPDDS